MGVPNSFTNGTTADATEVNDNFTEVEDFTVPIGGIIAWNKTLTGVPALSANWEECDGTAIVNTGSPMFGQSKPDLNTTQRSLRGSSTSGTFSGADAHTHSNKRSGGASGNNANVVGSGDDVRFDSTAANADDSLETTSSVSTLSAHMEVVWIMRVK